MNDKTELIIELAVTKSLLTQLLKAVESSTDDVLKQKVQVMLRALKSHSSNASCPQQTAP
jgi:hypothetical protein